jgi:hypothetical protein
VKSSIDRPATPVATHNLTLAATASGSTAKPPSKSAFTGTSAASAMSRQWVSTMSSVTAPSA